MYMSEANLKQTPMNGASFFRLWNDCQHDPIAFQASFRDRQAGRVKTRESFRGPEWYAGIDGGKGFAEVEVSFDDLCGVKEPEAEGVFAAF